MRGLRSIVILSAIVLLASLVGCSSAEVDRPIGATRPSLAALDPGTLLYVSPDGIDSAPGTDPQPVKTIARAAAMAKPGMTVVVKDGTYTGSLITAVSGRADARIAFYAQNLGGARIQGDGTLDAAWQNEGDYVDISGFDISGSDVDGLLDGGSNVRIMSNRIHGFREGNCITTGNDGYTLQDVDVTGNTTYGCGQDALDHGIYVSHTRGVVSNNISFGNSGYGIQCWHNCNDMTISNNLVFDNAAGGIVVGQGDSPNFGSVPADGMVVSNNIAVDNGRDGLRESGATGANNMFLNNLIWNNGSAKVNLKTGTLSGTVVQDPQFVDFRSDGTGNYRLQPTSPGVDGGAALGAPSIAIDGTPRPVGPAVDIGIYER